MKYLEIIRQKDTNDVRYYSTIPFEQHLLYLGEIPNMKDHCAVVDKSGNIHWGQHIENFETVPDDEL